VEELAMDEEVKLRLDQIDKLVSAVEKRFDDVKWYVTGLSAVFGFIFSVVLLIAAWNLKDERDALREMGKESKEDVLNMQRDIKEDARNIQKSTKEDVRNMENEFRDKVREQLGQAAPSKLKFLGANGQALVGQEIVLKLRKKDQEFEGTFPFLLRNIGKGWTGPISLKLYAPKELPTFIPSIDEPGYPFEQRVVPEDLHPNSVPGGDYSMNYTFGSSWPMPIPGRYGVLLRAYYGNGRVVSAAFYLIIR
jgi:hypothetical protein